MSVEMSFSGPVVITNSESGNGSQNSALPTPSKNKALGTIDKKSVGSPRLRRLANMSTLSLIITLCTVTLTTVALLVVFYWYFRWREIDVAKMHSEYVSSTLTRRIPMIDQSMADIAHAIQFGTSFESRRVLPSDLDESTWFKYWHKVSLQFRNPSIQTPVLSTITFVFADASLVFCNLNNVTNVACGSVNPFRANQTNYSNGTALNVVTVHRYNLQNTLGKVSEPYSYTTTRLGYRLWLQKVNATPWTKEWGYFSADSSPRRPSLSLIFPFYNSSGYYLGAGKLGMNFDVFNSYLHEIQPTAHSSLVLLNEEGRLLASGLNPTQFPTFAILPLKSMTAEERLRRACTESDQLAGDNETMMLCLFSIFEFGYSPLIDLVTEYNHPIRLSSLPSSSAKTKNVPILERRKLGGVYFWVTSLVFAPPIRFRWQVLLFMPESDIDNGARTMSIYAAATGVGGAAIITALSALVLRRLLKPLHQVTKAMRSASYLLDQDPNTTAEGNRRDSKTSTSTTSRDSEDTKAVRVEDRKLSLVYDIACIQTSYWGMVDELRLLRGYIPQHICDQIVKSKAITNDSHIVATTNTEHDKTKGQKVLANERNSSWDLTNSSNSQGTSPTGLPGESETALRGERLALRSPSSIELMQLGSSALDLDFGSLLDPSEVAMRSRLFSQTNNVSPTAPTVFFGDNALVDRDISVAVVNIVGFHQYAVVTHGADVTKHVEVFVAYIHAAAAKCGGVLDTFSGDKFWVSFNATAKCIGSAVAAACFGLEVTTTVNAEAAIAVEALNEEYRKRMNNEQLAKTFKPRFRCALKGVTVGVATGRAFVGPLGTSTIRRHTIISNAVPEAAALERQCCHYPGCNVLIGGDMIPAVEGYMQYLLIDACCLPGSNGLRRRIACVKAPMCEVGHNKTYLRGLSENLMEEAMKVQINPYSNANMFFNAFLEGRKKECVTMIQRVDDEISESIAYDEGGPQSITYRSEIAGRTDMVSSFLNTSANINTNSATLSTSQPAVNGMTISRHASSVLLLPRRAESSPHQNPNKGSPVLKYTATQRKALIFLMNFVWSHVSGDGGVDGRRYESPLGIIYKTHGRR